MALTINQLSITTDDSELHAAHQQIGRLEAERFRAQQDANYYYNLAQQRERENSQLRYQLAQSEQRNNYAAALLTPFPTLPQG